MTTEYVMIIVKASNTHKKIGMCTKKRTFFSYHQNLKCAKSKHTRQRCITNSDQKIIHKKANIIYETAKLIQRVENLGP